MSEILRARLVLFSIYVGVLILLMGAELVRLQVQADAWKAEAEAAHAFQHTMRAELVECRATGEP